jgi:hypothetical protein
MSKDRPILMSRPMVRATKDKIKTQTRRIIKPQPELFPDGEARIKYGKNQTHSGPADYLLRDIMPRYGCPYGVPGDQLWVRERLERTQQGALGYYADGTWFPNTPWRWKRESLPSIHMPKWASRITLDIKLIRAERLMDISEEDAKAEGAQYHDGHGVGNSGWRHDADEGLVFQTARNSFFHLWKKINGAESLKENPWLWVICFEAQVGYRF